MGRDRDSACAIVVPFVLARFGACFLYSNQTKRSLRQQIVCSHCACTLYLSLLEKFISSCQDTKVSRVHIILFNFLYGVVNICGDIIVLCGLLFLGIFCRDWCFFCEEV